ncbi:Hsp20/alpha crystallin family protein [uncultured Tateyamaria sp.]|uniref:Hsp20/alpha crystallin family protein n=1 Tax=uncultured Tateyamaria sp. TaxID=455651 RepID=UPI002616C006|nr:Hsp20/alpha crystallin family protein [uncultured Tateyamaria sp.]
MSRPNLPKRAGGFYPPFFQSFQNEMAQMLDHLRGTAVPQPTEDFFSSGAMLVPAIDVAETETGLEVSADIPGVSKDDIDVMVQGDTLVIKGGKSTEREEKEKDYHLVERHRGSFRRHIPLGFVPADGAVDANFSNGVLTLKIERPENAPTGVQKVSIGTS